jgi:hypothetical protein
MGWKRIAPCGASDLAKIRAGFLKKADRLIHGAPIANQTEWQSKLAEIRRVAEALSA